jgi:hypothetical protein
VDHTIIVTRSRRGRIIAPSPLHHRCNSRGATREDFQRANSEQGVVFTRVTYRSTRNASQGQTIMLTHCETERGQSSDNQPIRRLTSARVRSWLGTGVLLATGLALMSPPAARAQEGGGWNASSYLSDRDWMSMTNGWGPVERDHSNGGQAASDGGTLTLNGRTYSKGFGAHAPSDLRFAVHGSCSALTAVVGVDDEKGTEGSVIFQVWTDGIKQFDSGVMTGSMPAANVSVSLLNTKEIALILTDAGDGNWGDHGDWANVQISCGSDPGVFTVTTVSAAPGTRNVASADTASPNAQPTKRRQ